MTPEERARDIYGFGCPTNDCDRDCDGFCKPTLERIAAAIRAAENDALERAAKAFDREREWPGYAKMIRALKHKD